MKNLSNLLKISSLLLILVLASCKKDDPKPEVFDITRFVIAGKVSFGHPYIIAMEPGNKATLTSHGFSEGTYTYVDGVLSFNFTDGEVVCAFTIENDNIKAFDGPALINTYNLIKVPETNQLAGKTFAGTYYRLDNTVLHQNFFYSFYANHNKVGVGYTVGTPVRTENYTIIGNIAALVDIENSDDRELMVLINGKLEVGYRQSNPSATYIGSFTLQ